MTIENTKTRDKRFCYACGSTKTYIKKSGGEQWCTNLPIGFLCHRCYCEYISKPRWQGCTIRYKDKRVTVNKNPKIGICNICRAIKGQINTQTGKLCKKTDMAHISYHDDDPQEDSIEACTSCHNRYDRGIPENRKCCICGSNKTSYDKNGNPIWNRKNRHSKNNDEFICERCRKREDMRKKRLKTKMMRMNIC